MGSVGHGTEDLVSMDLKEVNHTHNWGTANHWGPKAVEAHLVVTHGFNREDLSEGVDLRATHFDQHGIHGKSVKSG